MTLQWGASRSLVSIIDSRSAEYDEHECFGIYVYLYYVAILRFTKEREIDDIKKCTRIYRSTSYIFINEFHRGWKVILTMEGVNN